MKKGGVGGANTKTGLEYEAKVDFLAALTRISGYEILQEENRSGSAVLFEGKNVGWLYRKTQFYGFLAEQGIDWKNFISKRLLPDDALLVIVRETLFIIEVKYQSVAGSVDEKLQTCDFKRKQYLKLVHGLGLKVEYVYVLSDWFKAPSYKDTLDYIHSVGCHYKFGNLPLAWLGLPEGKEQSLTLTN